MKKYLFLGFFLFVLCLIVFLPNPVTASSLPSSAEADVQPAITPPAPGPEWPVMEGEDMNYYVGVYNAGPDEAANVIVTIELPVGTLFKSLNLPDAGSTFTAPDVGETGVVRMVIPAIDSREIINSYLVITPIGPTRQIIFTATVTTDSTDLDLTNNSQTTISYFSAPSFVDSPPAVVSGYEIVVGTATPASPCNNPSAAFFPPAWMPGSPI